MLIPPFRTARERLAAAGKIREPRTDPRVDLRAIRRAVLAVSSAEVIAGVRGDR